jgi:hypothetical protein
MNRSPGPISQTTNSRQDARGVLTYRLLAGYRQIPPTASAPRRPFWPTASLDVTLLENEAYLDRNPPLRQFVATHPAMGATLQSEPRHLLHRALLREANVPLKWSEAAQLDVFLDQHPAIERQLVTDPLLICTARYLAAEPQLRAFLAQNAALSRGFLPPGSSF